MNVIILGAAGFIGTNLALSLSKVQDVNLTLVDTERAFFVDEVISEDIKIVETAFRLTTDYDAILQDQDVIYHLISTSIPTYSNIDIAEELSANVIVTAEILAACVRQKVKKIIFISSGGTVYGTELQCPLKETFPLKPITSYGVQKMTIERLLYLYRQVHGLDYRVVRLANPYGPYQRPNGVLGAVTTFVYKAINNEKISVYGNGSVVRDFIYIDDAIEGILKISKSEGEHRTFNLGCGQGISIKELLECIQATLKISLDVEYKQGRAVDVPINYLDISRYEKQCGELAPLSLEDGIKKTAAFLMASKTISN